MKFKRINLVIVIALATLVGCKKPNLYSDTPEITFKSITVQQDASAHDVSAHLVISFTDGDGDLGNNSPGAYDPPDFIVVMDTLHNGNWGSNGNDSLFSGTIPYLTPSGSNKALKGDIATDVFLLFGHPNDTVRYEVYIRDRALHKSNVITIPEIIIHTE